MPLYVLPAAGTLPIVRFIENAQGPLVINNYFLDSKPILAAITQHVQGGGKVWIILEPKPYRISADLVQREYEMAKATGAYVLSAPDRFATGDVFDHAKYAVCNNAVLIGTANWDYSAFHKNREYLYVSSNPLLVAAMHNVAMADLNGRQVAQSSPPPLVLSPGQGGAAGKIEQVLQQAGRVGIETEEIQPGNPVLDTLEGKGADAYLIVPSKLTDREQSVLGDLKSHGVHVRTIISPYMHAKMLIGTNAGFIGSQNFSRTSITENREVGVVLSSAADLRTLTSQFNEDWQSAGGSTAPLPLSPAVGLGQAAEGATSQITSAIQKTGLLNALQGFINKNH